MKRVVALDGLPLLGKALDKFPEAISPAVWWPQACVKQNERHRHGQQARGNGWDRALEDEMRNIAGVLERDDLPEYLRLGNKALKLNKLLAISGPLLTTSAANGAAMTGCDRDWELGGQVGMVVEINRNTAGFYKHEVAKIESTLAERDVGEMVALLLGRNHLQLNKFRNLSCIHRRQDTERKLF
ncbi:hypothetical protein MLD38_010548 [Melastoma candidum]|uniref:Uncharacterized protein n=1 Tax=Melastoma candidum TaxID=119954 RepID=A0ACB9R1H6_9MYRT|nr:hypothetical protein MLD38_010548 [Melastoma candidum]